MKLKFLLIALLLISCKHKEVSVVQQQHDTIPVQAVIDDRLLIVPGISIGQLSIEENATKLDSLLGVPDLSDAAMGKAWLTWYSAAKDSVGKNQLNVYTTYKDNEMLEKVIRLIRVTSADFKTSDEISSGSKLKQIQTAFPDVKAVASYPDPPRSEVVLYDDISSGIAFEVADSVATAIIIHEKDISVLDHYITFHPEMKRR